MKPTITITLFTLCACGVEPMPADNASTLRLALRADDNLRRAPVFMDHGKHTKELGVDSCVECHVSDADQLVLTYKGSSGIEDADQLMSIFHAGCIGCHEARADGEETGPVLCGGCHIETGEPMLTHAEMRWDYSLHGRHAIAEKDRCESCHHVYDDAAQKLVYVKGKESACRDCHGQVADGKKLAWKDAAHESCVNCHKNRKGDTGPVLCAGCHDSAEIAKHETLAEPPRILRDQPAQVWLQADGARSLPVRFDHRGHEAQASICSDCHHQTLEKCSSCHTISGSEKGRGVTLEMAYHNPEVVHSCVGCHEQNSRKSPGACAGCHVSFSHGPAERTCTICHRESQADGVGPAPDESNAAEVALTALPAFSNDYPEKVRIEFLKDKYMPSDLPHGAIVAKLDAAVRESRLATTFHRDTETLCSGCHHHSPVGERPPTCRSCHAREPDPVDDKPALQAAYHRQCMGCHEEMKLKTGCEDCHKEVSP